MLRVAESVIFSSFLYPNKGLLKHYGELEIHSALSLLPRIKLTKAALRTI